MDGHAAGDLALKSLAATLLANAMAYDIVSRYGGEEFLVLFPGIDSATASAACDRFRSGIAAGTEAVLPRGRAITVSVGIADMNSVSPPATGTDGDADDDAPRAGRHGAGAEAIIEAMLRNADAALYKAKAAGKNRCLVHDASTGDAGIHGEGR